MEIQIATAPVSWGVVMKDTPNVPPYGQVLDEIQAAGYTGTELGPVGYLPLDIDQLRDELAQRDLTLLSAFVPFNFIDPQAKPDVYEEALTVARSLSAMGCEWMILSDLLFADPNRAKRAGRIRPEDGLDESGWQAFIKNLDAFAKLVREDYGLKAIIHPHVGAYIETPQEIDTVMARSNRELVGLCLDTAHITYGGGDPVATLKKWQDRVGYLHIKECDQAVVRAVVGREGDYFDGVTSGVFPELGQGTVDFLALRDVLEAMDFQGWGTVEQDILPESGIDALASARRNRQYLKERLGW